jgi:hypothetical protein
MAVACMVYVVATLGNFLHHGPFSTWYYSFAWWSYILFLQALLCRRRAPSLLFDAPRRFLRLLPLSLHIWLLFEVINFRLANWHYLNVPAATVPRWTGYAIAFATVIPGIWTTAAALEHLCNLRVPPIRPLASAQQLYGKSRLVGAALLLLPLIFPRYFFPWIWVAFLFLLEPANHRRGAPSLFKDWEEGRLQRTAVLLTAGACCGLLWEFWNYWAGAKWFYTIPFLSWVKIFEMPLLGFLGFPPFALECWVMVQSYETAAQRFMARVPERFRLRARAVLALLVVAVDCAVFHGIDRLTVVSFGG